MMWYVLKNIFTPSPKRSELERVRDFLRFIRDNEWTERELTDLLNVSIKLLIDYEAKHGEVIAEEWTKEDLRSRADEKWLSLKNNLREFLEEREDEGRSLDDFK